MSAFLDAVNNRRSIYSISNEAVIPDAQLRDLLAQVLKNAPTAYNMQSTRMVLLLGQNHTALWNIVRDTLRPMVPPTAFGHTEEKIAGFAAGHGTILFFNDEAVTKQYMDDNPLYAENFPPWALQQIGMLQFAVWALLEEQGMGANLQHYNPLIDEAVHQHWNLPAEWKLLAQMPFGKPTAPAEEKDFEDLDTRYKVFG